MKAIYGLFADPGSAERAADMLRRSASDLGFRDRDLAVISSEPFDFYEFGKRDHRTQMPWIAALGGLIGGVSGYWFVAYTQKVYPMVSGGMSIVTKWTNGIITYELAMLGAILATLITLLVTAGIPSRQQGLCDPAVSDGKILIGVMNPPAGSANELKQRLHDAGAEDVKDFVSTD